MNYGYEQLRSCSETLNEKTFKLEVYVDEPRR